MRQVVALAALATLAIPAVIGGRLAVRAQAVSPTLPSASHVSVRSQAPARSFTPGCTLVLHLTPETFSLVYAAQTSDESEAGSDAAAAYWERCRQQATGAALSHDPALAARIAHFRLLLVTMQSAESGLASIRAGGGTMYFHTLYRAAPEREQRLADIVALAQNRLSGPSSGYSPIIDALRSSISDRLTRVQHPTKADLQFTTRANWNASAAAYVKAVRAVEAAAGSGNDGIRTTLLDLANQPLFLDTPIG